MRTERRTILTLLLVLAVGVGGIVYVVWTTRDQLHRQGQTISAQQRTLEQLLADRESDRRLIAALQQQIRELCAGRPNCRPVTIAPAPRPTPAPGPTIFVTVPPTPGPSSTPTPRPTRTRPSPPPKPTRTPKPKPTPSPTCTRLVGRCLLP